MRVLLSACVSDEGPHLLEWIAHHKRIGFTDFFIAENNSQDGTREALKILEGLGELHYYDNSEIWLKGGYKRVIQMQANRMTGKSPLYKDADWVMKLDADEFLYINHDEESVEALIEHMGNDVDAIMVYWRYFGSNHHETITDELVTSRFQASEGEKRLNEKTHDQKALFRARRFQFPGIHFPKRPLSDDIRIIDSNQNSFTLADLASEAPLPPPGAKPPAQINHYMIMSHEWFLSKHLRGRFQNYERNYDFNYWKRANYNNQLDTRLADRAPLTKAIMDDLDARSGGLLYELREYAADFHRNRVKTALETDVVLQELYENMKAFDHK